MKLVNEKINANNATLKMSASDAGQAGAEIANKVQKEFDTAFGAKPRVLQWVSDGTIDLVKQDGVWKIAKQIWTIESASRRAAVPQNKREWAFGASKVEFPKTPASGKVHGVPFKVEQAKLENDVLTFSQGQQFIADRELNIFFSNDKKATENSSFSLPAEQSAGSCFMSYRSDPKALPTTKTFSSDEYGMKLSFGRKQANGLLPGYIVLRLPDAEGSYVQGYFYAKCR